LLNINNIRDRKTPNKWLIFVGINKNYLLIFSQMKRIPANCPTWLEKKICEKGGSISFYEYMNIVLNDPINGYYGSGKADISFKGDFVTSPSLSDDFAFLLSKQIEDWSFEILKTFNADKKLTILEFGSGDGSLMNGIIKYFLFRNKPTLQKLSFRILELNKGMQEKQRYRLNNYLNQGIDIKWINNCEFEKNKFDGIVLAHEVLDAFPVERIQFSNGNLYQQEVEIDQKGNLIFKKASLSKKLSKRIDFINNNLEISIPPINAPENWTNELHMDNFLWFKNVYKRLNNGILLVIDYSLEAQKYYSSIKSDGNILSYKNQKVSNNILEDSGNSDLTAHLCNEILILDAKMAGFEFNGMVKQGEALLSLGLSKMIYEIQDKFKDDLSKALLKREALLRLVDPLCLGDFKWFVFQKTSEKYFNFKSKILTN